MPHKRNPSRCERVSGLARVLRSHVQVALENVPLWHERDISHSSAERVILPDACITLDYMLWLFTAVMQGLRVYPERMCANLEMTGGLIYSQGVLLALVESGMSRQDAYEIVQLHATTAWSVGSSFRLSVEEDPRVAERLAAEELDRAFSSVPHLRWVNVAYERMGLGGSNGPTQRASAEEASATP